jgi:lipoprotein-anchoring transpeptidase ErfK/SrfK
LAATAGAREAARPVTPEQVEAAVFKPDALKRSQPSPLALKLQVLLDRAHISPGVIDGVYGESTIKAIRNFQLMSGVQQTGRLTQADWDKLVASGGTAPILKTYELQKKDVKGPFIEKLPTDYEEKAKLKRLAYTSVTEALGEKFHLDEAFLKALNPDANFEKAGETITVVDIGAPMQTQVERIEVDSRESVLRAYGEGDRLLATYPATVGSRDMPSPSGSLTVRTAAKNPVYNYDPTKLKFPEVKVEKHLKIAAGPNNPVGTVWIDLDRDTFGIHGTPEPSEVGKEASHGCVRLMNWDVEELAVLVRKGTRVDFVNAVAAR